jgi:hypothetical protein
VTVTFDADRVAELLSIYRRAALEEAAASAVCDFRGGTRHRAIVVKAWRELRAHGPEATACLLDLLADMHPQVRVQAATHALEFAPAKGEEILAEVAVMGGPVGTTAELALKDWRARAAQRR